MHSVTIPEGYSLSQIIPLFATKLAIPAESLQAAVRDTAFVHQLGIPTATVEGYVFPDTYIFPDKRVPTRRSRWGFDVSSKCGNRSGRCVSTPSSCHVTM